MRRPSRIKGIKRYLEAKFPGHVVEHFYENDLRAYTFRLEGTTNSLVSVSDAFTDEFLPDDEEQIVTVLSYLRLATRIGESQKGTRIVVTTEGIKES